VGRYEICHRFIQAMDRKVEAVPGNHDMVGVHAGEGEGKSGGDSLLMFRELFGCPDPIHRVVDVKGYRIFFLNSVEPLRDAEVRYRGWIGEAQREWLRGELARTPRDQPLIVCTHIPFRTTFKQEQEGVLAGLPRNLVVEDANETLALFKEHRLMLVLQAHLHVNEWLTWNERHFLMGGAVCGKWWRGPNLGTEPGFGLVEIRDGRLAWLYMDGRQSVSTRWPVG